MCCEADVSFCLKGGTVCVSWSWEKRCHDSGKPLKRMNLERRTLRCLKNKRKRRLKIRYVIKITCSKWIEYTSEYTEKCRIYCLNSHNYVCGFTIQDDAVISKDRLPLIGSSRNKSAGAFIVVYMESIVHCYMTSCCQILADLTGNQMFS